MGRPMGHVFTRDYGLYFVLDLPAQRDPVELVTAAVAGGATIVQLRGKDVPAGDLYQTALAVRKVLEGTRVPLVVNDRLDVAMAAGAEGVHVGGTDLPFERVRQIAPGRIVGVSCYGDLDRARQAVAAGVDYVAFGAFSPSPSKPEARVVPLETLAGARDLGVPVVAIGGITVDQVEEIVRAGADGVAVISAIQGAPDPEAAARDLRAAVERGRTGRPG
ncbi:MAG: thiamine phosphate synthase [Chloroflexota bacterium]|nr:thiamine phosphate synthase [Chloroflexota bacterium]